MNILLSCSGGFSSSIIVKKIKDASEKKGAVDKVWTVDAGDLENHVAEADVVLMAPQIMHLQREFAEHCAKCHIPLGIISHQDYGLANGENVLAQAEKLVAEYREK